MGKYLETSIVVSLSKNLRRRYYYLQQWIDKIYKDSQIHKLINLFCKWLKICFRYSFFGRITDIREEDNLVVLDNSRAVQYLIIFYKRWRNKTIYYLRPSFTFSLAKDTKEELILSPVRMISLIVIITILVNAVLSVILQKQIGFWSFFIRVLFLFVATAGLSCEADWSTVKESSVFLRKDAEIK